MHFRERLVRFITIGAAVGSLAACGIGGWGGSNGGGTLDDGNTTGWNRAVSVNGQSSQGVPGGFFSHAPMVNMNGNEERVDHQVKTVYSILIFNSQCEWDKFFCTNPFGGVGEAAVPDGQIAWVTRDTNGDGVVSGGTGGTSPGCGISSGLAAGNGAWWVNKFGVSGSFQDQTVCPVGPNPAFKSTAQQDCEQLSCFTNQNAGSPNSLVERMLRHLPLEKVQDILNSVHSSDLIQIDENGRTALRVEVTKVTIGGQSYEPYNVYLDLRDMSGIVFNPMDPGLKLLAAWAGNTIDAFLDRGATNPRVSIELNGSATISLDQLGQSVIVTPIDRTVAEGLRNFATSRQSDFGY